MILVATAIALCIGSVASAQEEIDARAVEAYDTLFGVDANLGIVGAVYYVATGTFTLHDNETVEVGSGTLVEVNTRSETPALLTDAQLVEFNLTSLHIFFVAAEVTVVNRITDPVTVVVTIIEETDLDQVTTIALTFNAIVADTAEASEVIDELQTALIPETFAEPSFAAPPPGAECIRACQTTNNDARLACWSQERDDIQHCDDVAFPGCMGICSAALALSLPLCAPFGPGAPLCIAVRLGAFSLCATAGCVGQREVCRSSARNDRGNCETFALIAQNKCLEECNCGPFETHVSDNVPNANVSAAANCSNYEAETTCDVTCNDGFGLATDAGTERFTCAGFWTPASNGHPHCVPDVHLENEPEDICPNLNGIYNGGVACCAGSCGSCGGSGCSQRPGGASACCQGVVSSSGKICGTGSGPPCVVGDDVCAFYGGIYNGGNSCCSASCGICGGPGCSQRPGGVSHCCQGNVSTSAPLCGGASARRAPCRLF